MGDRAAQIKDWVKERPYLEEIAGLHEIIAAAIEENAAPEPESDSAGVDQAPAVEELKKGVPLLRAVEAGEAIIAHAAGLLEAMTGALVKASPTEEIKGHASRAQGAFQKQAALPGQVVAEVLETGTLQQGRESLGEIDEGFIVFLTWSALSGALEPLQRQLAELLEEHTWRRGYCPLCGHLPAMGYLFHTERGKGRERDLVCGCCRMRWRYKRIGCPYCDNTEQGQLNIIGLDDEPELRIDTCDRCKAYLKTYMGEGKEEVALADWSTLHLDLVAKEKGFKRSGHRMYTL